jgi:hypothetical protein
MLNLGDTVLPLAVHGLEMLIPLLKGFSDWVTFHPKSVKALTLSFLGLSAAMAIGGTVILLSAAFRGLGLALAFNAIGGWAGIAKVAGSIRTFGTAMLFSQVGGAGGIANIGKSLTSVSGGLGLLTQAAGAFMAAYAGWKAGGWLNENVFNPAAQARGEKDDTVGSVSYDYTNPFNPKTRRREHSWSRELKYQALGIWGVDKDELAADRKAEGDALRSSPYVRTGRSAQGSGTGDVYLDGKKVGKVLAPHLADQLSGPQRGTNTFDSTISPAPVGMNVAR